MKKILISFFISQCFIFALYSQQFTTKLFLQNAKGEKDTLEVGYDPNATEGVDVAFGEKTYTSPIDTTHFKAFIVSRTHGVSSFLKKQIIGTYVGWVESNAISIVFPYESSPVDISWDNTSFNNPERDYSLITDWPLGGWFDASGNWIPKLINMKDSSTVQFNSGGTPSELASMKQLGYVYSENGNQIPLRTVYLAFASKDNFFLDVNEINSDLLVKTYPNPVVTKLNIQKSEQLNIKSITITSLDGKIIKKYIGSVSEIDCSNMSRGLYLLAIELNTKTLYKKIIKE
jgi:hypothetical protein